MKALPSANTSNAARAKSQFSAAGRTPKTRKARSKKVTSTEGSPSPFPDHLAPTQEDCHHATHALERLHGRPRRPRGKTEASKRAACGEMPSVLRALVATILSQNTTNANSTRAMQSLMQRFNEDWKQIWEAPEESVADAIRSGGLANIKAHRIKVILDQVLTAHGDFSLDHLHDQGDLAAKEELMAYSGVGAKTASCVLLFCLKRESFAVDTHVFRIAKRLRWVPQNATRDQTHAHLELRIPDPLKYRLHVLMVEHGKCCIACAANNRPQRAPLGACPLDDII